MLLHIMPDEKVISRTIELFDEALPNENKYIIIQDGEQSCYVKTSSPQVFRVHYNTKEFWNAVGNISSYSCLVIHGLSGYAIKFINTVCHPKVVWIIWGADMYLGLLEHKGYKLYYKESVIKQLIKRHSLIRDIYSYIIEQWNYKQAQKALSRITHCAANIEDYRLLTKYYPLIKSQQIDFYYYPVDSIVNLNSFNPLGDNIMVGHCASMFDNQEEVFAQLSKIDLKNRKVIAPLGYGHQRIKEYIVLKGTEYLSDAFKPILGFLPLGEYNNLMLSARTFIYGNYRQEAFGNILIALYSGGAVFLHPSNVLLKLFKDLGVLLFSTTELCEKIHYCLTEEERMSNRAIIKKYYSRERLIGLIKAGFGESL